MRRLVLLFLLACRGTERAPSSAPEQSPPPVASPPVASSPPPTEESEEEPKEVAAAGPPTVGSLVVQEVAAVLEANRPKIRRCASDRGQTGRVKITFTIAPKGHVTSATAEEVQGFDAAVVRCMVGQVKALQFAESSGDTKIRFPMLVTH